MTKPEAAEYLTKAVAEFIAPADTSLWPEERRANCQRIARQKTGNDMVGWIEDAPIFHVAIEMLKERIRS